MDELIILKEDAELVTAMQHFGDNMPIPLERDVFLLGTFAAGADHVPGIDVIYEALEEGDPITLIREPENPFDEYAIRLEIAREGDPGPELPEDLEEFAGQKIGYIPRGTVNKIFARLMDAGKLLYGVVRTKETQNNWHRIVVKVYLKD